MTGRIIAMARHGKSRAPIEEISTAKVSVPAGIEGDLRGTSRQRQITILAAEDWRQAVEEVGEPDLAWTTRRANLLVEGIALPRTIGSRLQVGAVTLEVRGETEPCDRMDAQCDGLRAALTPEWRGGIFCTVIAGGVISIGDSVEPA